MCVARRILVGENLRLRCLTARSLLLLSPQPLPPIPAETAKIARAAFPQDHPALRAAGALGELFTDDTLAALFPRRSQHAGSVAAGSGDGTKRAGTLLTRP